MLKRMIKRAGAYLIDYLIISLPLVILCMMWGTLPMFDVHGDYPFVIISFVYMPWLFWYDMLMYPIADLALTLSIFMVCIAFESIVYSMQEYISGRTFGKKAFHIMIKGVRDEKIPFYRIFARNVLKVTSKFFLGIPFFLMYLLKGDTVYDILTKINVCDGESVTDDARKKKGILTAVIVCVAFAIMLLFTVLPYVTASSI